MRCACLRCGVYMAQSDDSHLGCVCPECGNRCTACLGTNSVMTREQIENLKRDPLAAELLLNRFAEDKMESDGQ